jgi:hypothetical protein
MWVEQSSFVSHCNLKNIFNFYFKKVHLLLEVYTNLTVSPVAELTFYICSCSLMSESNLNVYMVAATGSDESISE